MSLGHITKIDIATLQEQFKELHRRGCTPTMIKIARADLVPLMQSIIPSYEEPEGMSVNSILDEVNGHIVPVRLEQDYEPGTLSIEWSEP